MAMSGLSRETLELISSWAEILTAAFGILAATAAVVYLLANRPLKKLETHDNEVLKGTVSEAQRALLVQQERADIAAGKLAGLEQDAADAKTEMAKQQTIAATAERSLLELQNRIKPRNLTAKQAADFVEVLRTLPGGTIDFGYTSAGGDETFNFAKQFLPLFKKAGWIARNEASIANHLDVQVIGVGILTSGPTGPNPAVPPAGYLKLTPTLATLQSAFRAVGIEVQFINWFPGKTAPEVVIGSKPQPAP
jgi:hypothetical protein